MWIHENLKGAFLQARGNAPCGIAYYQGQGWGVYKLTEGPANGEPEFLFLRSGLWPLCLTGNALQALASLMRSGL